MIIDNEGHDGPSVGFIPRIGGGKVLVWSYDESEILAAYDEATTHAIPQRPASVPPGSVVITPATIDSNGRVTGNQAIYDNGGDEQNKMILALYDREFQVWQALCESPRKAAEALIAKGKR